MILKKYQCVHRIVYITLRDEKVYGTSLFQQDLSDLLINTKH